MALRSKKNAMRQQTTRKAMKPSQHNGSLCAYKLLGPPALNGETKHIWKEWKQEYDIEDDIDVTHQYLTTH